MEITAASMPTDLSGPEMEPGLRCSRKMPVPPKTVNQNMVASGGMIAVETTRSRMVRPLEMRATKMDIRGP